MLDLEHQGSRFHLRTSADSDIPALRKLINDAYKELSDRGWNYSGTYQDETATRQRCAKGRAFVLELNGEIVATILFTKENFFTARNTAYISQFAVSPSRKKAGLGTMLMDYCENLARTEGFEGVQLDTAQPAAHLVHWYTKRGYEIVGELHWEGKTYDSFVFEKTF